MNKLSRTVSDKEREEIVQEAVERTILMIPEIIGNLIMNHASKIRTNKEFYEKFPDLKDYRDIVASVVEGIEDEDLSKSMAEILEQAVPKIRRRIDNIKNLSMDTVSKPTHGAL